MAFVTLRVYDIPFLGALDTPGDTETNLALAPKASGRHIR